MLKYLTSIADLNQKGNDKGNEKQAIYGYILATDSTGFAYELNRS